MYKFYVYLILSENRLVILKQQITDKDYHELVKITRNHEECGRDSCKMFCLGYILGSQGDRKIDQ